MIEIKGTVVSDSIKNIKANYGDQVYNTIVGLLKGETRALFEQAFIVPSSWYPLDAYVEFLEMDLKVTAQGDEQELIKRSEAVVERQLSGVYHMFVESKPELLVKRVGSIHQTYFQGVAVEVSTPSAGKAIVKYTGFEKQHRLMGLVIIGFYRKALEMVGAKAVKVEFATPIEDGKGYSELVLTWDGE